MALGLCMARLAPVPKDNPVSFPLPQVNNAPDASMPQEAFLPQSVQGTLPRLLQHVLWSRSIATYALLS